MEKRLIIIFEQPTGGKTTWTNPTGETFQIVYVLNFEDCALRRMFIQREKFIELNVKGLFSKRTEQMKLLEVEIGIDENNHEFVNAIEVKRFAKISLDKELD